MKSIKEKAKEYDMVVERIAPNKSIVDTSGREQFEAGANYVLEQIESLTKYNRWSAQDLYNLIEQLKKQGV